MALLRYSALRLALFLVAFAALYLLGVRNVWVAALLGILVSGLVSAVLLYRVRNEIGRDRVVADASAPDSDEASTGASAGASADAGRDVDGDADAGLDDDDAEPASDARAPVTAPSATRPPATTKARPKKKPGFFQRLNERIDASARAEDEADDLERAARAQPMPPVPRPDLPGWEEHLPTAPERGGSTRGGDRTSTE